MVGAYNLTFNKLTPAPSYGLDIYLYLPPGKIWRKVFFKVGIRRDEVSHESRLMCCWSMLVIDSLGPKASAVWVFAKWALDSKVWFKRVIACHRFTKYNVHLYFFNVYQWFTRPKGQVQYGYLLVMDLLWVK